MVGCGLGIRVDREGASIGATSRLGLWIGFSLGLGLGLGLELHVLLGLRLDLTFDPRFMCLLQTNNRNTT